MPETEGFCETFPNIDEFFGHLRIYSAVNSFTKHNITDSCYLVVLTEVDRCFCTLERLVPSGGSSRIQKAISLQLMQKPRQFYRHGFAGQQLSNCIFIDHSEVSVELSLFHCLYSGVIVLSASHCRHENTGRGRHAEIVAKQNAYSRATRTRVIHTKKKAELHSMEVQTR